MCGKVDVNDEPMDHCQFRERPVHNVLSHDYGVLAAVCGHDGIQLTKEKG